jgi:hypothetical protein
MHLADARQGVVWVREHLTQRGLVLQDLWTADERFDALCDTPQEFERKRRQLCIVQTATDGGIEVELA